MGKRTKTTSRVKPPLDTEKGASEGRLSTLEIRNLIDDELGRSMAAYRQQLDGANPYRLLEFASRCAERVWRLGVVLRLQKPEASRPIRLVTGLTALAARLAEEAVNDPGRLKQAETAKEAKDAHHYVASAEIEIYLADRSSHSVLELGRVAARLFEAIEAFFKGDEALLARRVASVAAHAEKAMTRGVEGDAAKVNRDAIQVDLEAVNGEKSPRPFPSLWPRGREPFLLNLSKEDLSKYKEEEFRYKNIDVAKIRFQQSKEPPPGLEGLSVPTVSPGAESDLKHPDDPELRTKLIVAEERTRQRLKEQLDDLQGVLNVLANKSFGTHDVHNRIVEFITTLADRASAVLTISGEFLEPKDKSKDRVFSLEPITIRCDDPKTKSLGIRSSGRKQTRILNTTTFPQLYAIPRERIPTAKENLSAKSE